MAQKLSNDTQNSVSLRIKTLRNALGLSQRELAREFRVSAGAVAHWETGERQLSGPVEKLLEIFEAKAKKLRGKK